MPPRRISRFPQRHMDIPVRIGRMQEALGRVEKRQAAISGVELADAGSRVFSQDLVAHVAIKVAGILPA